MTDDNLLVRIAEEPWVRPAPVPYDSEDMLESLLAAHPTRIPGIGDGALVARQLPTSAGHIDICVVGRDGSIVVVECKLSTNSEHRRRVVGQVIDYASAIWAAKVDAFLTTWEECVKTSLLDELDETALDALRSNIDAGRISLCLAVDTIDREVQRLIEYLNEVTRPEIAATAVALQQMHHGGVDIVLTKTYGGEIASINAREGDNGPWTVDEFLAALTYAVDREKARALLDKAIESEVTGPAAPLWFGSRNGGGIALHPHGCDFAPAWLNINKAGRAVVQATWSWWKEAIRHPGYEPLAAVLGLDVQGPASWVPVADLDVEELWTAILRSAEAINA